MQGRVRLKLTIEGPVGGAKKRLLECIRDAGYNVSEPTSIVGSHKIAVTVMAPHGEVR